jgi:2'-5' RNA ligase
MSDLLSRLLKIHPNLGKSQRTPIKHAKERFHFVLWPDEHSRQAMEPVFGLFPQQLSSYWISPPNLHLNLVTIGGIEAEWLDDLKHAASKVKTKDFIWSMDRLTYWPERQLLCLTPSVVPMALDALFDELIVNIEKEKFNIEKRSFRPYLTLAHKSAYPPPEIALAQPILWKVESFALIKSYPEGLDVAYEVVETWRLSKAEGNLGLTEETGL